MGGGERVVAESRLKRFEHKSVEDCRFRAHMVRPNVFRVRCKPGGQFLLDQSLKSDLGLIPFVEPQVCPPLHGDKVSKPL